VAGGRAARPLGQGVFTKKTGPESRKANELEWAIELRGVGRKGLGRGGGERELKVRGRQICLPRGAKIVREYGQRILAARAL